MLPFISIYLIYITLIILSQESIEEWAFRKLPQNVNWISVSSTDYVIQQHNVSFLKCVVLCSQTSNCNSVFLHLETCYGSYLFTPDTTYNSDILVYSKKTKNGMYFFPNQKHFFEKCARLMIKLGCKTNKED